MSWVMKQMFVRQETTLKEKSLGLAQVERQATSHLVDTVPLPAALREESKIHFPYFL